MAGVQAGHSTQEKKWAAVLVARRCRATQRGGSPARAGGGGGAWGGGWWKGRWAGRRREAGKKVGGRARCEARPCEATRRLTRAGGRGVGGMPTSQRHRRATRPAAACVQPCRQPRRRR